MTIKCSSSQTRRIYRCQDWDLRSINPENRKELVNRWRYEKILKYQLSSKKFSKLNVWRKLTSLRIWSKTKKVKERITATISLKNELVSDNDENGIETNIIDSNPHSKAHFNAIHIKKKHGFAYCAEWGKM